MADDATPEPETPQTVASRWLGEIDAAGRHKVAEWHTRGDKIVQRYKDERSDSQPVTAQRRRMNILWSNVQTVEPACYSLTPKPNVQRRNKDKDPVGRWAAIVLERCLKYCLSAQDFDYTMRLAVNDYLLPGRGAIWEVYEPKIATVEGVERVEWEVTRTKYIHWKDFLTNPARVWGEVTWCAHRAYLTRAEVRALLKQVGGDPDIAAKITLDHTVEGTPKTDTANDTNRKATVWCIWSMPERKTIYVSKGYADAPLGITDPPLRLDSFFPCPRPLTATTATDSIIPVPDYCQYQDQAEEIDELTQRISMLTQALIVRGVYDSAVPALGQLLNDSTQNNMIPVDTWAVFAEKGGLKGAVDFFPLEMVVATLKECLLARDAAKQALYEITGISDILRGASDPNETLGAQQIKTQWGGLRVRDRQQEVQRFARDIIRIKAEVIAETFSPETLKTMSGVKLLTKVEKDRAMQIKQAAEAGDPQAQQVAQQAVQQKPEILELLNEPTWDEVLALLKADKLRGFSIDIETDSTVQPDENAERQAAVEFGATVGGFLQQAGPIAQQAPEMMPLLGDLLTFIARRFKAGETLETQIETTMENLAKKMNSPQQKPDPEAEKRAAEIETLKAKTAASLEGDKAKTMADIESNKIRAAADIEIKQQSAAVDGQMREAEFMHKTKLAEIEQGNALVRQQQKADGDARIAQQGADTKMQIEGMRADHAVVNDSATGKTEKIVNGAVTQMSETLGGALGSLAEGMKALAAAVEKQGTDQAQQGADFKEGMAGLAQSFASDSAARSAVIREFMDRRRPPSERVQ